MLHCDSLGNGPDVVLLHGWGWHGGVWDDVARALSRDHRVWIPDLPGHGRSDAVPIESSLSGLQQAVRSCVPCGATWVGWSLGGLVALTAAAGGDVARLVLVGSTPRFVQGDDWECGLTRCWFDDFSHVLARDAGGALQRFASLHLAGNGNERPLLRRLRAELLRYGTPGVTGLQSALCVLEQSDLRAALAAVHVPTLVWHGAKDQIAAPDAGAYLARSLPHGRFLCVPDAGHASFISHRDEFVETVGAFLRE